MMKSVVLGVVLLNFILLLACTRVQVEILQPAGETEKHTPADGEGNPDVDLSQVDPRTKRTPDPGKKGDLNKLLPGDPTTREGPGAALRSDFIVLTQATENLCATDSNVTRPVAQETGVWCWAASAQGVMSFHNVNPLQCDIVNIVKAGGEMTGGSKPKPFCCENKFEAKCQQNGWTDEVFNSFGIDYKWFRGTLSQIQVARQICRNGPFIYSIEYEGGGGHTFVVKDYWMDEEEGMSLWVDTHESFKDDQENLQPSGFKSRPYKEYLEGSYDGTPNIVDFTYYLIKPQT